MDSSYPRPAPSVQPRSGLHEASFRLMHVIILCWQLDIALANEYQRQLKAIRREEEKLEEDHFRVAMLEKFAEGAPKRVPPHISEPHDAHDAAVSNAT